MAFKNSPFSSTSWADDDDEDDTIKPVAGFPSATAFEAVEQVEQETHAAPAAAPSRYEEHGDRRGHNSYGDHHGHRDREDRQERPRNPVPDAPPFKAYFGNLSFDANEDDIYEFLRIEAVKDIHVVLDDRRQSKGFGYVEFETRDDLVEALKLDGEHLRGRRVKIDAAIERKPRQKENSFFSNKRRDHHQEDAGPRRFSDAPAAERPRLQLAPRSISTSSTGSSEERSKPKTNPFGDARPRDENTFLERQKQRELERKQQQKERQLERKQHQKERAAREEHHATAPAAAPADHERVRGGGRHGSRGAPGRAGRSDRPARKETDRVAPESEAVQEEGNDSNGPPAPASLPRSDSRGREGEGRGRGRGRGRGSARGRGRGGRGHEASEPLAKAAEPQLTSHKADRQRTKSTSSEPPQKAKVTIAPPSMKTTNAFAQLSLGESDSESD